MSSCCSANARSVQWIVPLCTLSMNGWSQTTPPPPRHPPPWSAFEVNKLLLQYMPLSKLALCDVAIILDASCLDGAGAYWSQPVVGDDAAAAHDWPQLLPDPLCCSLFTKKNVPFQTMSSLSLAAGTTALPLFAILLSAY